MESVITSVTLGSKFGTFGGRSKTAILKSSLL